MSKPAAPEKMPAAQSPPSMIHPAPCQAHVLAATSTAAQSPGKHAISQPRERPSMEDLPRDVLEVILGLLDRETLCTARLVSKPFCAAASMHICSLTFRKTFQAVSSCRFPRLSHVTVNRMTMGKLEEVHPFFCDIITTLDIRATTSVDCRVFVSKISSHIPLLPKLRELDVSLEHLNGELDVGAMAGGLCNCTNLEILRLTAPKFNFSGAMTIAFMTSLIELHIIPNMRPRIWTGPSWVWSPGSSWLEQATALTNLRALSIVTPGEALPLIGNLTGLTALSWVSYGERSSAYSIAPLTRLTNLKSVGLRDPQSKGMEISESNADIACSLGLGSLCNLDLQAADSCGKFLTRQTALTQLSLGGELCDLRHIGPLRLELLQSLTLRSLASVDAEGLSSLCKATSLTHLGIGFLVNLGRLQLPDLRLSKALAGLTQLRSLVLSQSSAHSDFLNYAVALRPLTGLTRLGMSFVCLDKGGFRALLNLTGLRVLDLSHTPLIDDMVPELGVLTNLKMLRVFRCGVTSLAPVTDVVNPLRHARGWPPMNASLVFKSREQMLHATT